MLEVAEINQGTGDKTLPPSVPLFYLVLGTVLGTLRMNKSATAGQHIQFNNKNKR